MKLKFKHIGLLTGLVLVITSFLFFGRHQGIYMILLTIGLLISWVFSLIILISKGTIKSKIIWFMVIILAVLIQLVTESKFIDYSYMIYIRKHKNELTEINNILLNKKSIIHINKDTIVDNK